MVGAPEVVWHTTTGNMAVTIGPEPAPDALVVEVDAAVVGATGTDVLDDAVPCFGWVDPVVAAGPDDPHAANSSAPTTAIPANLNIDPIPTPT